MDTMTRVGVVNAGSSSLKLAVLEGDQRVWHDELTVHGPIDEVAMADALAEMRCEAIGHRFVHGGRDHVAPVRLDDAVLTALAALASIVPTHQPLAIDAARAAMAAQPGVVHVGCFDTAFHSTLSEAATTYAIPATWRAHGVRRYGFHGLSYGWATERAAALLGRPVDELGLVIAHLGSGASLCAVQGGRSVDTTMGFTPVAGLVMSSRSGDVDPGALAWLLAEGVVEPDELRAGLEGGGGLVALCGSGDMREIQERADPDAALAMDVYVHRLVGAIGSMIAALDRFDALVFTGGVGEHSSVVRRRVGDRLRHFGVTIDDDNGTSDSDIATPGATPRVLVIEAREDVTIARLVRTLLGSTTA